MSDKKINLEEIQRKFQHGLSDEQWNEYKDSFPYPDMRAAMKEACKQALELAAEQAKPKTIKTSDGVAGVILPTWNAVVDKQSIIDTLSQIE